MWWIVAQTISGLKDTVYGHRVLPAIPHNTTLISLIMSVPVMNDGDISFLRQDMERPYASSSSFLYLEFRFISHGVLVGGGVADAEEMGIAFIERAKRHGAPLKSKLLIKFWGSQDKDRAFLDALLSQGKTE